MAANSDKTEKKKPRGKGKPFPKGKSGNPNGRPTLPEELRIMCQGKAADAIKVAAEILNDKDQPANARLQAANVLLDRGYGKAPASLDVTSDGAPLPITIVEVLMPAESKPDV